MELQYVYLIQEREFFQSNQSIYKVGQTKQPNFERFSQYPKGSQFLCQLCCDDCISSEKMIIQLFKSKYIHRKDIGNEYFDGNYKNMRDDIANIVKLNNSNINKKGNMRDNIDIVKPNDSKEIVNKKGNNETHTLNKFCCSTCGFCSNSNSNLQKHIESKKHIDNMQSPPMETKFQCKKCLKYYQARSGLWKHEKKCVT